MFSSSLQPYYDILMHQVSDLMEEADAWSAAKQIHVHAFWLYLDRMMMLTPEPQLPVFESRQLLDGLWCEYEALNADPSITCYMTLIGKALVHISHLIDEHLSRRFELPIAR